jgi:hypothetical protein
MRKEINISEFMFESLSRLSLCCNLYMIYFLCDFASKEYKKLLLILLQHICCGNKQKRMKDDNVKLLYN